MKPVIVGLAVAAVVVSLQWNLPQWQTLSYATVAGSQTAAVAAADSKTVTRTDFAVDARPVVQHVPKPEAVRAIYMSACVAGTPSFRQQLVNLIHETEINSVVIDIKDYSGTITFAPSSTAWQGAWQSAQCGARDMREFITALHQGGIYVIGRITVFQDPYFTAIRPDLAVKRADGQTVWKDYKGLSFIDVAATEYWDHIIELSVDAYNLGFDELNYDYVRYPSDGPMNDIAFVHSAVSSYGSDKQANLEAFFSYLNMHVNDPAKYEAFRHENIGRATATPWTSVDLFGMTTTNYDDLSIGQILERAAPYFDFVAPMVYPSHYPDSFLGLGNPNEHPYRVVQYAMQSGVDRLAATTTTLAGFQHVRLGTSTPPIYSKPAFGPEKFRTWIQDFDYGGDYDATAVRAQIQASYDAGVMSYMVWAPSNIYTKEAYLVPPTAATSTPAIESRI